MFTLPEDNDMKPAHQDVAGIEGIPTLPEDNDTTAHQKVAAIEGNIYALP
jgi:hypothetical protein